MVTLERPRPQDDYFSWQNQEWLQSAIVPDGYQRWSAFEEVKHLADENIKEIINEITAKQTYANSLEQKIKFLYESYLTGNGEDWAKKNIIESIMLRIDHIENIYTLFKFLGWSNRYGVQSLILLDIESYFNRENRLYLMQSGLFLPDAQFYSSNLQNHVDICTETRSYIHSLMNKYNINISDEHLDVIWNIENKIAKIHVGREARRNIKILADVVTWDELRKCIPLPWDAFAQGAALSLQASTVLCVPHRDFFTNLPRLLNSIDLDDFKLWLKWKVASSYAPYASIDISEFHESFISKLFFGKSKPLGRRERARHLVTHVLGEGIGSIYVTRRNAQRDLNQVAKICSELISMWKKVITNANWITDQSKALAKLENLQFLIGYPNKWRSYDDLNLSDTSLLSNWQESCRFAWDTAMSKISSRVDTEEWSLFPHSTNATYNITRNRITIPLGLLESPIYAPEKSFYSNLGSIGCLISHEIAHAFDKRGVHIGFDASNDIKFSSLVDPWFMQNLEERISSSLSQWYSYLPHNQNSAIARHFNELYCDILGFWVALRVLERCIHLSKLDEAEIHQVYGDFFEAWATLWRTVHAPSGLIKFYSLDRHAPPSIRCNFVLSNCEVFSRRLKITSDDQMWVDPGHRLIDLLNDSISNG